MSGSFDRRHLPEALKSVSTLPEGTYPKIWQARLVKTTIEVSDALLREAKATAALRGVSLRELFEEALRGHLEHQEEPPGAESWRQCFGRAERSAIEEVDSTVAEDLERVERKSWR